MKRYHDEQARIRSEHRFHLRYAHHWPQEPVDCDCEMQAGRFRKKKALDCGKADLHALSLREDLQDCFQSGPCQAIAGEGLGKGLLRGVGKTMSRLARVAQRTNAKKQKARSLTS